MTVKGRTLSQAAAEVGVEPSTIKYWCEEFGNFIRPARTPGGHRRFSDEDIQDLLYLKQLLHVQNFSIKQAKDYLNQPDSGPEKDLASEQKNQPVEMVQTPPPVQALLASLAEEICSYVGAHMNSIAREQLQDIREALEQTAASTIEQMQAMTEEQLTQWSRMLEHAINKTNERIGTAATELKRTPQEVEEIKKVYAEVRDRWLTEESKVRMEIQRLRHELNDIQNQGFWQRLRWAFMGWQK